jgi:hypothetical protein
MGRRSTRQEGCPKELVMTGSIMLMDFRRADIYTGFVLVTDCCRLSKRHAPNEIVVLRTQEQKAAKESKYSIIVKN